jgi:putative ABC transport system substrate-binding protein
MLLHLWSGELGWSDAQTIAIEYRWADGHPERASEIAAEFVRLNVDVIVKYGDAVPTIKKATTIIPVVFALANNPVGGGLVASLARPGGNVTGLSSQSTDIVGKRLELLHDVAPGLRQLIVMFNAGYPDAVLEMGEVQDAAHRLGLEVTPLEVRREDDIHLPSPH